MKNIRLTDLIDVESLQQIQDGFSKYTGMAALMTDSDGVPVTTGSGFTKFCMELTRKSPEGCKHCEECDKNGALLTLKNGHASVYDCHAGLVDFAAPIMVEGNFIGSVIGGQVRTSAVNEEKMKAIAEKYGINSDEYISAAKETRCLEKEDVQKAAIFLEEIAAGLSGMAYKSYIALQESARMEKASKSQADFVMNMSLNLEKSMERWFNIVEGTLQNTSNQEVRDLLNGMQDDGKQMRSNIRDTIEYIRISENKIEIRETEYKVKTLRRQILDSLVEYSVGNRIPIIIFLDDCEQDSFYGDSGRIGQMLSKTIKTIVDKKKEGEILVGFSSKKVSYATMLCIKITETKSNYTPADIDEIKAYFEKDDEDNYMAEDVRGLWLSFEGTLLKKMAGTIKFEKDGNNFIINIAIPQLAV